MDVLGVLRTTPRFTPLECTLEGREIKVADGPSAASQYSYIFQQQCYDFPSAESDPLILDCGANIGIGVLFWKQRFPKCRIVAFEADPYVFDFLSRNCGAWGFDGLTLLNKALWSSEGTINFDSNKADGGHVSNGDHGERSVALPCTRLSPYLDQKIALLKMDIEGAELEVMEECKDKLSNVERIFVEYHSFEGQPQRLDDLLRILKNGGYRYYIHPELESPTPFRKVEVHNGKDLRLNIFAVRR